jgi:hypothetical protein
MHDVSPGKGVVMFEYENRPYFASPTPCINGHVFYWASGDSSGIPEGTPCQCGHTTAHWDKCEHCGSKTLKAVCVHQNESVEA